MITEHYRQLNAQLHQERPDYGSYGHRWATTVMQLCSQLKSTDVLDYGCGKGTLNLHLPFGVHMYDPAIPKHSDPPEPADIVVCADVMEHVEPEHVDEVLDDLARLTRKRLFLNIATRPAKKTLPDGRNTHLTVQPAAWWIDKLQSRWTIQNINATDDDVTAVVAPTEDQ